eukprot:Plantae.Rhodophyta-Hildenbrandia_rubra.ctg3392.p1 GENE.Plantae.Rhodophyta-Hildenbrandia_rubra.ctg3392~~Plantae.Rhodophyta-Hildenbrandia_rubra.ctg3392.p1  ORF type:complete len:456 (+),score=32.06 Plantae.Rhodophyta-Hildenbrandia_rubra.ctg3392:2414-3781(+)
MEQDLCALKLPSGDFLLELKYVKQVRLMDDERDAIVEYCNRVRIIAGNCIDVIKIESNYIGKPGFLFAPVFLNGEDNGDFIAWDKIAALNSYKFGNPIQKVRYHPDIVSSFEYSIVQSRHDHGINFYRLVGRNDALSPSSSCRSWHNGYSTFEDFFSRRYHLKCTNLSQPMIRTSDATQHVVTDCPKYLMPENCRLVPVQVCTVDLAGLLCQWHCFMATHHVHRSFSSIMGSCDINSFSLAMTPATIDKCHNYERLEWLGDAVLELFASISVTLSTRYQGICVHRHKKKSKLVCNSSLSRLSILHHLELAIDSLSSSKSPLHYKSYLAPQEVRHNLDGKLLADTVEALIGLHYLKNGFGSMPRFLDRLEVTENLNSQMGSLSASATSEGRCFSDISRIRAVEAILGYTFQNKKLLVEALTHVSFISAKLPRRLDFLGHAVLYLVVSENVFDDHHC